ncbi:hypothetical protein [Saccharospirillum salsuginis]|uniref:Uncharacterized protein n=1 Tax=Saccharospirillum salsuginis TaxID=418750 RepID=A0A918N5B8_9GAMM|nr:hypothetical protein [Saccharospirillum salsuginis]GGX41004.1 hypothetical protein GCM10007392_04770 [Saccharospirillum salsuginis]
MTRTIILFLLTLSAAWAHQPVHDKNTTDWTFDNPYVIEKPEVSKAIYAELNGAPDVYRITIDRAFDFYAGITQPKWEGCARAHWFSVDILDENRDLISSLDGERFEWWAWYEEYGKQWYWIGPESGEDFLSTDRFPAGTYYLKVYNQAQQGLYVLAVGDDEQFGPITITRTLISLPGIEKRFWEEPEARCRAEQETSR